MFKVVHAKLGDVKLLLAEPLNAHLKDWASDDYRHAKHALENALALTIMYNDEPVLCAFFAEIWTGRAYGAFILSEKIKNAPVSILRGMKKVLPQLPYNRIEMDCPVDLEIAHRRAKFLGFELMCSHAKKYMPDGSDASVYQWVRA